MTKKTKQLERQRDLSKEMNSAAEHNLTLAQQEVEKKDAELKLANSLYKIKVEQRQSNRRRS